MRTKRVTGGGHDHLAKTKRRGGLTGKQLRKWRKAQTKRRCQAEGKGRGL